MCLYFFRYHSQNKTLMIIMLHNGIVHDYDCVKCFNSYTIHKNLIPQTAGIFLVKRSPLKIGFTSLARTLRSTYCVISRWTQWSDSTVYPPSFKISIWLSLMCFVLKIFASKLGYLQAFLPSIRLQSSKAQD